MLAEWITKLLVVFFGYAYPAFECFKTLEQQHGNYTVQLRFWCQYWIIVAILTAVEMLGEFVVSLLPMYGELKLAFLVYLWYPKTKGSDVIYDAFLRPIVMQYEPNIEDRFKNLRANSGKLLVFYLKNFTEKGYILFQDVLHYVVSKRSGDERIKGSSKKKKHEKDEMEEFEHFAETLLGTNANQRPARRK
ncbi:HVA22-like protein g isoform X2 [Canna indica]|uniref:HVA22-like protein n=1 Tax=Canna indica TaxID=4628 RepID=A0AAQ3QKA3_9LILI|nr:HVA22-like protein g isoform X2 [Canna indica]